MTDWIAGILEPYRIFYATYFYFRNGVFNVWSYDEIEVVCLASVVLFLH